MKRRPGSNDKTGGLERRGHVVGEAGLHVDDVAGGMEAWPLNGIASAQVIVEDARNDLDEGATEPGPARGADGER